MVNKGGRPTKYHDGMPQLVLDYITEKEADVYSHPCKEDLASVLEVDSDTIREWVKIHPRFSVTIRALSDLQSKRLQHNGLTQKFHPTMCIFLLKNNHGMTDRHDVTSAGEKLEGPILYLPAEDE